MLRGAGSPGQRGYPGPSCDDLNGADGLAVAPNGDLIVAVNHQNKLVRVDGSGKVTTLVASSPLDFPTSLVFVDGDHSAEGVKRDVMDLLESPAVGSSARLTAWWRRLPALTTVNSPSSA